MARKNYSEIISQRINARRAKQEEAAQASSGKLLEKLSERLSGSSYGSGNASESTEDFITRTYNDALSKQQGYRDTIFAASEKKEADKRTAQQEKRAQAIANATGSAPAKNVPANSMTAEEYKNAADTIKKVAFARNMPQMHPADALKNKNAQFEAAKVVPNKVLPIAEEKDRFAAALSAADLLTSQQAAAAEADKQKRIRSARPVAEVQKDIEEMNGYIDKAKKDTWLTMFPLNSKLENDSAFERLEWLEGEKKKLEQELDESRYAERELLKGTEDFEKNSQYKSTKTDDKHRAVIGQSGIVTSVTGFKDPLYEYVNKKPDVIKALRESKAGETAAASFFGIDNSHIEQMNADEVAMFNYITNKEGSEKAREYLESITNDLTKRQNAQDTANYAKFAEEHPVIASAYSAATSPLKASAAVGQTVDYLTDGKIDQNAGYNRTVNTNNAIRETVNQTVTEKWGEKGSFAYQTGMGMADFLATTAATGGFSGFRGITLAVMGASSAANTVISAKERGLSDDQAYSLGVVAGAVEIAAEKAGLDALFEKINFGKNKIASAVAYMLKNAGSEATEEGVTELANFFADVVVSKDKSEWNQSIAEYKKQGMSEKEAFNKAFADEASQVLLSAAGGFVSGSLLGAAGALVQTAELESEKRNNNKDAEDQKNSTVKALESATDTNDGDKTDAPSVEAAQQTAPAETQYEIDEEIPASEFDSYILRAVQTGRITPAEADALDAEYGRTFSKKEAEDGIKRITAERQKGQISEEDFDTQYEAYQNQIDETELKTASSTFRVRLRPIQNQPVTVQTTPRQDAGASRQNEGSVQERAGEAIEENAETPTEEENAPDASESKPKTTQPRASYTTDARTMRDTGTATTAAEEFLSEDSTAEDAADELVRYYGSVHEAVKRLQGIREKTRSGGASENAEMFNRVRDVERQIVNENKSRVTKHTKDIARYLSDYGIRDIVIDDPDAKKLYGTPKEDGYFDPKDNTIHITAHSSENKVLDSIISHEFSHRAMREDPQLVSDILSARDHLAEIGKYRELYTPENYRAAYADQIKGKSAEEAENLIREEMAAHFMGDIFGSENLAQALAKDNRPLLRRILDFIVDKFDPKGKNHRAGMRAADKIRRMLDDLDGKTTTKRKPKTSETAGTSDDIRYSRDVETADEKRLRNAKDWNDYYRRQYTAHTAFGKAKAVKPSERHRIAVEISHDIPGVSSAQVERLLKEYFDILERPKNGAQDTAQARWEEAETALGRISAEIVDNAVQTQINPLYEPLRDLRRKLRETPIKSDVSAAEFGGEADYKAWRKGNTGLLRISTVSNALPIDTFYQELSGEYPDFFPEDITNTADQLKRLGEIAVSIKETASNKFESVNPLEEVRMQAVEDVKARMRSGFDKYARLTDAAKSEVENAANKNDVLQARAEGQSAERYNSIMLEDILKTSQQDGKRLQREIDRQNKRIQKLEDSISDTDMNLKRDFERQKHRAELERLYKMLTEPTKRVHVPDSLKNITARTLAAFDGEKTSGNKTVDAEFMKKIADTVIHTGVTKDYVTQNFSDAVENGMKRATEYRAALEAITPEDFKANPEESARKAAQLEYDYLRESNAVLEMIGNYITNANRVFIAGRAEEATDFAQEIRSDMSDKSLFSEETARNNFGSTLKNEGRSFFRKMHYEAASPTQFFALFGESGKKILKTLQSARDVQKAREETFADYMLEATGGKYNTSEASGIGGKRITINIGGKDTDISRAQLMYVYALWKDPSARYEMKNGGISILDANGSEVSDRRYTITDKTFAEITEKLSDEDKKIADAIEKFLSGPCAEWGNEATLRMFGYSRFTKKDYMPVRTVFDAKETAESKKPASLEDAVFTRARNTEAKSPVVIGDIFDIATHHVKHMAAYSANAPVINDLNLVFAQKDVKHDIRRGLGKEGEEYLEWFMQKLNDPNELTNSESATYGFMQWLGSTAQRAAVNSNVSSAVKQFLSLPRAFVEISPKYILKAYADTGFTGRRKGKGTYGTTYRRMTEHSGIAKIKMLGFSDTGYGKSIRQIYDPSYIRQSGTGLRRILTASKPTAATLRAYDRMNEFGMLAAEKADENVWTHLYRACELEVLDTHPNASAEEREALAASRFNQLVGDTQVVDSLLDTARGKESFKNKAVGYFMSEPLKTYAMLCGAIDGVKDAQALVKKNPTDANRKKLKAARTKLNKTTAAIIATNIALEPLISAFFRTTRDEEDDSEQFFAKMFRYFSGVDLTEEKLSAEPLDVLSSEVVAGLFDIIPVVGAVYDIVETAMQGFSSDRFELTNFVKLLKSAEDVISDAGNSEDGKKSTDTAFKNIMDLISAAASVAGTGFSNVYRDVNAAIRAALHLSDNHLARWEYNKLLYNIENSSALSQKNFYDILAHTVKEGDLEAYAQMREDLANLPRTSSLGVSVSTFADNIKKRGVEPITPDSPLWNIEIQARFALGDLNTANSYAEKLITEVYNALPETKKTYVLYTSPNKNALEEQIKRELTYAEYENAVREIGTDAYKTLIELNSINKSNSAWKNLSVNQKRYTLETIYDYARYTGRKKLNPEYETKTKWMQELYKSKPTRAQIVKTILSRAAEQPEETKE